MCEQLQYFEEESRRFEAGERYWQLKEEVHGRKRDREQILKPSRRT